MNIKKKVRKKNHILNIINYFRELQLNEPHIYLLVLTILFIISFVLFQTIFIPKFSSLSARIFSPDIYNEILSLESGKYTESEKKLIDTEVKSLRDYFTFFKSTPYEDREGLINTIMMIGNILTPIIGFLAIFIVPLFLGGYCIWFIWNFWLILIKAIANLFLTILKILVNQIIVCPLRKIKFKLGFIGTIRPFRFLGKCHKVGNLLKKWLDTYIKKPLTKEQKKYIKDFRKLKRYYKNKIVKQTLRPLGKNFKNIKSRYDKINIFYFNEIIKNSEFRDQLIENIGEPITKFLNDLVKYGDKYYDLPYSQIKKIINNNKNFIKLPYNELFDWIKENPNKYKELSQTLNNNLIF